MTSIDDDGLGKTAANYVPLSPLSFLGRASAVFPGRAAVIYGAERLSWRDVHERAARLASALTRRGVSTGDRVAVLLPNTPPMVVAHFGVPLAGAVLNAVNTRLDAETIAYILEHGEAKVVITDTQFSPAVKTALAKSGRRDRLIVDVVDPAAVMKAGEGERLGALTWDELLAEGDPQHPMRLPDDEWRSLALNYTSGTSGRPKGVVYHHRGAYLMSLGTIAGWSLPANPTYLYVVPMFHCNGWCHVWAIAAMAGTMVLIRSVTANAIFAAIAEHGVTHFGGAPIVLGLIINAAEADRRPLPHGVNVLTAGAPPPAAVIERMEALGFDVTQVYGLTETYGHVSHCAWNEDWDGLDVAARATIKARQGVCLPMTEAIDVVDPATGDRVARDGVAMGEIVIRGNTVMKGYYKDKAATAAAFEGGHFHSGDLAVMHPNGYVEIKDRLKDIIISGGENISSIEVESVLYRHPAVAAAAIVAMPDETWGEVPCAFVELKPGAGATEPELIAFCRRTLAGFKTPKAIIIGELPKTSTGKIQKYILRQRARGL